MILQSFKCLRSQEYQGLSKHSSTIRSLANLNAALAEYVDNPSKFKEALDIIDLFDRLNKDHAADIPFIATVCKNVGKHREYLLVNLCNYLDDLKEPSIDDLKQIVNLLVGCGEFTNRELRLRFLQARDYWFNNECESRSESFDELITFFCRGLPKIFEEFKAIFADSSAHAINRYAAISSGCSREDGAIINSWLLLKTTTFIHSLEIHIKSLGQSRLLTPTMVSDTMEKCFSLTNWLASIGFDFSSQLRPLFVNAIIGEVRFNIERSTVKFETEFTGIVSKSIESLLLPIDDEILRIANMRPEEQIPKSIEHYPVFKIYCLHLIDSLRWIRATQNLMSPICLCIDVYACLNASLSRVMQAIAIILNTDNNSSHPILSKISISFMTEILPYMSKYCELIFPEKLVLSAIGLSKTEFKALCAKEPDSVKNMRLNPPFLEKFQRHLGGQTMVNV